MANRVLRDWTCSETIDQLSELAELFFTRLIMKADDYGRFYGSPKLLKSQLFPLKDYSLKQIEKIRNEVVESGIVLMYIFEGKEYLEIKDFNQRLRIMKSKFPEPLTNDGQMTDICTTDDGLKGKENETETEEETKPKKAKIEIPSLDEFFNYVLTIEEFAPKFESLKYSIQSKYESWVENGWKDGHNNDIKQWKTKLKNTLPHLKPLNNFNNANTKQPISVEQRNAEYLEKTIRSYREQIDGVGTREDSPNRADDFTTFEILQE